MNILVTGASGFVGSSLCQSLIKNNYHVTAIVRAKNSKPIASYVFFKTLDANTDFGDSLKFVNLVIHLAGRAHILDDKNSNSLAEYRRANVDSTLNLARQAALAGVKRFIFVSSVKVNGELTENNKLFSANDIPNPQNPYGISKLEAELGLMQLSRETGMEVVIVRPPLVYGPNVKANFLSMIKILDIGIPLPFGNIGNKRSLVFIDNLVDLLIRVIEHPKAAGQVFLVSDDHDVSTTTLLKAMSSAMGKKAKLIPIPSLLLKTIFYLIGRTSFSQKLLGSVRLDISKTKKLLNWSPPVSFEKAIEKTGRSFLSK